METHDAVVRFTRARHACEAVSRQSEMRMPISLGRPSSVKLDDGTFALGAKQRGLKSFSEPEGTSGLALRRRFIERVERASEDMMGMGRGNENEEEDVVRTSGGGDDNPWRARV